MKKSIKKIMTIPKIVAVAVFLLLNSAIGTFFFTVTATAATIYVNSSAGNDTTGDGTSGSPYKTFHKGYTMAASGDTLNLTGTFTWSDADETGDALPGGYAISKNLTIQGQSAGTTIIQTHSSYGGADRGGVFTISAGYTVTINDVTIRFAYKTTNTSGGGISNLGTLTVNRCAIYQNYVHYPTQGGYGGGIYNVGTLTVQDSTINNNFAQSQGGGIVNAYTASNSNTAYITNSTIAFNSTADNLATVGGAGFFQRSGTSYITNSTIAYNNATNQPPDGSGTGDTSGVQVNSGTTLYIKNSIVAYNEMNGTYVTSINGNCFDVTNSGTLYDNGGNIFGKVNTAYSGLNFASTSWYDLYGNGTGDSVFTKYLTPTTGSLYLNNALADNSTLNNTQTLAIGSALSIAINNGLSGTNGPVSVPSTDQRGLSRSGATDIGAYEYGGLVSYTVTYNGNGNTGGSAPVDGSSPYASGATVTVLGAGTLVKTGYTFTGWNTAANGSGTAYAAGATFAIAANTTLYAQWTINTYTVTANPSGTTTGTVTITSNTGGVNCTWNGTAQGGTCTSGAINSGTSVTLTAALPAGTIIASWGAGCNASTATTCTISSLTANTTISPVTTVTYTVTYNGNGNTGGSAPVDGSSPYTSGATVTVLGAGTLVRTGYFFAGWNTAANGSGTDYAAGATFSMGTANVTLYAKWTAVVITVTTTAGAAVMVQNGPAVIVDSGITVVNNTGNITGGKVSITSGFASGDTLACTGNGTISCSYNATTGILTFTGTDTPANWQTVFRTVTIRTTSASTTARTVAFTVGSAIPYSGNGHFYEYISTTGTWTAGKTAAAARTLFGLQGYLATITSQGENDFIQQKLGADAWIGASDEYTQINAATGAATYANQAAAEGRWYWVTGPVGEIGTNFSNGNTTPVVVAGKYMNWNAGEPNNWGGAEHYGEIYSSAPSSGKWNDLLGGPLGYVVEYGGLAGDPVVTLTANKTVNNTPQYTVTPSAGANGTINPSTPQTINNGSTTVFTVTPNAGYTASVGGTCGGALAGTTYTTNAITANCTVSATFTAIPSDPAPEPAPAPTPTPQPQPDPQPVTIPSYNPQISYTGGGWQSRTMPGSYSGSLTEIENMGGVFSSVSMSFEGTTISLRSMTGPRGGTAKVYIDGAYITTINLHSTSTAFDVEVFSRTLSSGAHTLRIVPEPLLPGRRINIDRFIITR